MTREERLARDGFAGMEPVLFYGHRGTEWPYFSNFSRHSVWMIDPWTGKPTKYMTTEHRYQAMKSVDKEGHDYVWAAAGPGMSKKRGREVTLRDDWGETYGTFAYYVMLEAVMAKAAQHPCAKRDLLSTGLRPIYEDSPTDDIWGWRFENNHSGANLLGTAWMQVRELLQ